MKEREEHRRAWREVGGWALAVAAAVVIALGVLVALAAINGIRQALSSTGEAETTIITK